VWSDHKRGVLLGWRRRSRETSWRRRQAVQLGAAIGREGQARDFRSDRPRAGVGREQAEHSRGRLGGNEGRRGRSASPGGGMVVARGADRAAIKPLVVGAPLVFSARRAGEAFVRPPGGN
jgi:hypothetical protein